MIVIFGATGNTGQVAARTLLGRRHPVRVVARHQDKLAALERLGAQGHTADMTDAAAVARALEGARAAYLLIPPNVVVADFAEFQARVSAALVEAARKARLRYAVVLSSLGAHHARGTGPITGLHRLEQELKTVDELNVLFIRAGFFMENYLMNATEVKNQGNLGSAAPPDVPLELIATHDIGSYAAERLIHLDFSGHKTINLVAPRPYTMREVAAILGGAIGQSELPYRQLPLEQFEQGLLAMGVKPATVALYLEMYRGANAGLLAPEAGTETVRGPTTLEEFAPTFAMAFGR